MKKLTIFSLILTVIISFGMESCSQTNTNSPGETVKALFNYVKTKDFKKFERIRQADTDLDNRNSALFPEKINGRYARFDRPMYGHASDPSDMCISYSEDLKHWGDSEVLISPRAGSWDGHKV